MILSAEHITKSYQNGGDQTIVLNDVNLKLRAGEMVSVVGPSGCGKSTLLNVLGTLDTADSGILLIEGQEMSDLNDEKLSYLRNQTIGFIFQFHHLLTEFTVLENLLIPTMIHHQNNNEAENRALELLEQVGMLKFQNHKPSTLSGGEKQRVSVLRALMNKPKLVFADEPTGNLDIEMGSEVFTLMEELKSSHGCAFLIATHSPEFAAKCDKVFQLNDGVLGDLGQVLSVNEKSELI